MNPLRYQPPLRRAPLSNSLVEEEQNGSLPFWAGSADFRDFERGADGRSGVVPFGSATQSSAGGAIASQTAEGFRGARPPGIEEAGHVVQAVRPQILQELKRGGFTDDEARSLFEAADKVPDRFWLLSPGRMNNRVTPEEDNAYRSRLERGVSHPALRKKALDFYRRELAPGGRLQWRGKE